MTARVTDNNTRPVGRRGEGKKRAEKNSKGRQLIQIRTHFHPKKAIKTRNSSHDGRSREEGHWVPVCHRRLGPNGWESRAAQLITDARFNIQLATSWASTDWRYWETPRPERRTTHFAPAALTDNDRGPSLACRIRGGI